jgi:hypothetical protein
MRSGGGQPAKDKAGGRRGQEDAGPFQRDDNDESYMQKRVEDRGTKNYGLYQADPAGVQAW